MYEGGENKDAAGSDNEEQEPAPDKFMGYFTFGNHAKLFKIVVQNWGKFCLLTAPIYIYHLLWTIAGINAYADYTRENPCTQEAQNSLARAGITAAEATVIKAAASSVFDTAIALVSMWHMIEWIRWTFFITAALVEANLMPIFHVLQLNVLFGVVACLVAIAARYGSEGESCALPGVQAERAFYCGLQIISLVLTVPLCAAHTVFMKCKGKQWCDEEYAKEEEDDD